MSDKLTHFKMKEVFCSRIGCAKPDFLVEADDPGPYFYCSPRCKQMDRFAKGYLPDTSNTFRPPSPQPVTRSGMELTDIANGGEV